MNEQDSIEQFMEEAREVLSCQTTEFEFLFVDDGSSDNTLSVIQHAGATDLRVRWISFSRNFGKEAAISAGLLYARGDAAVIIDADLQHPLEIIPLFIEQWSLGHKMVFGIRNDRKSEQTALGRLASEGFYRAFNKIAARPIAANAGDFRLVDRVIIDAINSMPERNRFMKGLYSWPGYSCVGLPYSVRRRQYGASRFRAWRLWNFALDGIVGFSDWPLRVWSYIGFAVAATSFLYGLLIVLQSLLFGIITPGYPSLMVAVLFLGGVQLISVGVLGEYIGRIFAETKNRPLYIVADTNIQ